MKTMIAFGLVMLAPLLAVTLRRNSTNLHPLSELDLASAESRPLPNNVNVRLPKPAALLATKQAQPLHDLLLETIEAEIDPDRRSEALERVVESVSDSDLPVALASLAGDVSPGAAELSQLLVRRWAEKDAPAAAAWTSQLPDGPLSRAAREQIAIAWANTDLPAAADWVQALPEGVGKQAATLDIAYEAARTEPIAALELVSTLPPTQARDDLLVHAISQWSITHPTDATAWAMQVIDSNLRQRLVVAVAVALAEQDPAAAATLAASSLWAGEEQDRAAVSIVQRWAQNSPQAAASWVAQFPDMPSRDAAVSNLLALWVARDAEAAKTWLSELPVGTLHDFGIAAYTQALADRDRTLAAVPPIWGM